MSDEESPLEELIRTGKEVAAPMFFIRKDSVFHVPYGVMERFLKAVARAEAEKETK